MTKDTTIEADEVLVPRGPLDHRGAANLQSDLSILEKKVE